MGLRWAWCGGLHPGAAERGVGGFRSSKGSPLYSVLGSQDPSPSQSSSAGYKASGGHLLRSLRPQKDLRNTRKVWSDLKNFVFLKKSKLKKIKKLWSATRQTIAAHWKKAGPSAIERLYYIKRMEAPTAQSGDNLLLFRTWQPWMLFKDSDLAGLQCKLVCLIDLWEPIGISLCWLGLFIVCLKCTLLFTVRVCAHGVLSARILCI